MAEGDNLPDVAEIVRQYLAIVLAANGHQPVHWAYAEGLHYMARRVLERRYFYHPNLPSAEEAEVFAALEELHKCPLGQIGVPSSWWQVQMRLRRVMPLVQRLLAV
ncbi:MAG: hypothetical protein ACRYFZ_03520 [Janthinobacterium lividum]